MKLIKMWRCETCGTDYTDPVAAEACEALGFKPSFEVGQIVTCRSGFGWYDGMRSWVTNPDAGNGEPCPVGNSNCFDECCTYSFYYVVTYVDGDQGVGCDMSALHRPRYHLATNAMQTGYRIGYTFDDGHLRPVVVENPPRLRGARKLIGTRASGLV